MMTLARNFLIGLLAAPLVNLPATAATVSASGSAEVFFQGTSAYDDAGNTYDWQDYASIAGQNFISASSSVSAPNGISSTPTITRNYTITNTSVNIFIDWLADFQLNTFASANSGPGARGDYYYDSNTFLTAGGISSFASVNGTYRCSVLDGNDPGFDCFGYSAFFNDPQSGSSFGTLAPGESVSFELSAQSFATQRFVAAVPLPASGLLMGLGLLVLFITRRWRMAGMSGAVFGS
jgi:hypothetical protein